MVTSSRGPRHSFQCHLMLRLCIICGDGTRQREEKGNFLIFLKDFMSLKRPAARKTRRWCTECFPLPFLSGWRTTSRVHRFKHRNGESQEILRKKASADKAREEDCGLQFLERGGGDFSSSFPGESRDQGHY